MQLTESEYRHFMDIYLPLMHYVGTKTGLISKNTSLKALAVGAAEDKISIRDTLYQNPKYFDKFVKENPFNLSNESLDTILNFKHFRQGRFWVLKYLKSYAIFLGESYVYGVVSVTEPFSWFLGNSLPVMVETVLLPFKDKIIYDGFMTSSNLAIGGNLASSLHNSYNILKAKYGVITQLPVDEEAKKLQDTDENTLVALMQNKSMFKENWYDIEELLDKNPSLINLYEKLVGKLVTKDKQKALKKLGVKGYHFAITGNTILTSGESKKEVEARVASMVDETMLDAIHYFKV